VIKKYLTSLEVYLDFHSYLDTHFRDKMTVNFLYFPMDLNSIFITAHNFHNSIAFHAESPYLPFFNDSVYLIWSFFTSLQYSSAAIGFISFSYSFACDTIICSTCTVFCASVSSAIIYWLMKV